MPSTLTLSGQSGTGVQLPQGDRVRTNRDYGIYPDTGQDLTTAIIQWFNSYDGKSGEAQFEPGGYKISQIPVPPYLRIRGYGTGGYNFHRGTVFYQEEGVNKSAFTFDPEQFDDEGGASWAHGIQFHDFVVLKVVEDQTPVDTIGSGFEFNARLGEDFRMTGIRVLNFPEDGIWVKKGGKPLYGIDHCSAFGNGRYGISFHKDGGNPGMAGHLGFFSADRNGVAAVKVGNFGTEINSMVIEHLAVESRDATINEASVAGRVQPTLIEIENVHCQVDIRNVCSHSKLDGSDDPYCERMIHVHGPHTVRLSMSNMAVDDCPVLLYDEENDVTFSHDPSIWRCDYRNGTMLSAFGDSGSVTYSPDA